MRGELSLAHLQPSLSGNVPETPVQDAVHTPFELALRVCANWLNKSPLKTPQRKLHVMQKTLGCSLSLVAVVALMIFGLQTPASATEPDSTTDNGALIVECLANGDFVTVFGQVWNDEDGDDRLLEDLGVAGVQVEFSSGPERDVLLAETDDAGFWAYCLPAGEAAEMSAQVNVMVPDGRTIVTPGAWPEDEDSDVGSEVDDTGRVVDVTTESFVIADEITGRDRRFESSLEMLSIRIDVGLSEVATLNPCPDWSVEFIELDPDGDWDSDGVSNRDDSLPCELGVANPCPEWTDRDVELDPDGDWDGDGLPNSDDELPCQSVQPPPPNPCDNPSAEEIRQLAEQNPSQDWDSDGLVNGVDPTPCDAGVGDPCPDWLPIHTEEDSGGDWDGDGIANIEDSLPCDSEPVNPCPEWNTELANAFADLDWDGDGVLNGADPLPCDEPGNPCPDVNDLWIAQDPGGDWDGDGVVNAEDRRPCDSEPVNPCPEWNEELRERDPFGDWDEDGVVNVEDEEPCAGVVDVPCPEFSDEDRERDPFGDWDEDGVVNVDDDDPCDDGDEEEPCPPATDPNTAVDASVDTDGDGVPDVDDEDPCDPTVPGDTVVVGCITDSECDGQCVNGQCTGTTSGGGGFPWSPWGPIAGVATVIVGCGVAFTGRSQNGDGTDDNERKKKRKPTATITEIDLS